MLEFAQTQRTIFPDMNTYTIISNTDTHTLMHNTPQHSTQAAPHSSHAMPQNSPQLLQFVLQWHLSSSRDACSTQVVAPSQPAVHHKLLNRWLQPAQ